MLLCDVRFSGTPPKGRRWDAFGGSPDPSVQINDFGTACAYNTHDAFLSWHSVTLAVGDKVKVSATDIDMRRDDSAGMDIALFEGSWPVHFSGDHFSANCQGMTPEAVVARMPARVEAASSALSAFQRKMIPEPLAENWGWPDKEESTARRHIEDVAGHTGWDNNAVRYLLSNESGLQVKWAAEVATSMAQTLATLPGSADLGGGLSASVSDVQCTDSCELTLQLHNQGGARGLNLSTQLEVFLIAPDGRDLRLTIQDELPDGVLSLDAGQQRALHLHLAFSAPQQPSMIRIISINRHYLIPLSGN